MTEVMYGYHRLSLTGQRHRTIEDEIRELAAHFGASVPRIFAEPSAPEEILWSLLVELDRCSGGHAVPSLLEFAQHEGIDVRSLIWGRTVRAVQWQELLAELNKSGGYVIVPSPRHLEGIAESRSSLLQHLSHVRVSVIYLDRTDAGTLDADTPAPLKPNADGGADEVLIGDFTVKAFAAAVEVALLKTWHYLSRAGLNDLTQDVDVLVGELIGPRVAAPHLDALNEMRIRLLRTPLTLHVDVHETENHTAEPIPDAVRQRCLRTQRFESGTGGTVTSCELTLTGAHRMIAPVPYQRQLHTPPESGATC